MDEVTIENLKVGELVYLSGYIYTARDAGHKKICDALDTNKKLKIDLKNKVIYYVGPTPPKENQIIGSAGPTTSGRMDAYSVQLMNKGLKAMIGKGDRADFVKEAMKKNKCIYFAAIGGAGALLSKCIVNQKILDYKELDSEALRELEVVDMPLVVAIDSMGNSIYEIGKNTYLEGRL